MSRIAATLARGRSQDRPLVVPFVTAGFPHPDATEGIVRALEEAGADMIEIGVPFSDPLADGPTIQRASEAALAAGVTLRGVLGLVNRLREGPDAVQVPLLLMGYCNPMFRYGLNELTTALRSAGGDGLIVPDLPPEEAHEYREACAAHELSAVFLMAPNAPDDRIRTVDRCSTHFSYCVSVTGVTGARGQVQDRTLGFLDRVGRLAKKPCVVGFGVQSAEHVRLLGPHAAGVVVGSALIDAMEAADDPARAAAALVRSLRAAAEDCRGARAGGQEAER